MRRTLTLVLLLVWVITLSGCFLFEPQKSTKTLTTLFSDSPVVEVRYYTDYSNESRDEDDVAYRFEELDEDEIDEFVENLNSMEIKTLGFKNYWWGGHFGIEMTLEDGTYLTYDGTKLTLRKTPADAPYNSDDELKDKFVEVVDRDFWEEMKEYFPSIVKNGDKVY